MIEQWGRRYGPVFRFSMGPRDGRRLHGARRGQRDPARAPRRLSPLARARDRRRRARARRPVHLRGRRLAPPAPARGHRAELQPPAPLLRDHPHRHRAPARAAAGDAGRRSRSSTTSCPTASTSRRRWPSGTTSTRSSTATASCSGTSRSVFEMLARRTLAPFPYWHVVKPPADRAAERSLEVIHEEITGFIADARKRMQERPELEEAPENFLESMLTMPGYDDHDVFGNVFTMLLAGEDTTANTLSWAMYLLARDPAAQRPPGGRGRRRPRRPTGSPQHAEDVDRMRFARGRVPRGGAAEVDRPAPLLRAQRRHHARAASSCPPGRASSCLTRQVGPPAARASASTPTAGSPTAPSQDVPLLRRRPALLPGPQPRLPGGQDRAGDARAQLRVGAGRRRAARALRLHDAPDGPARDAAPASKVPASKP